MKVVICLLKEFVLWEGKNFFKNCCCISFQARMNPDLRFYNHVLALSFNEKWKSFNLMMFILQFKLLYVLQTSSNSFKCKYGFSISKPWKVDKSWIMSGLKLKWDASGGKTMHDGALVLVGFMWSLSVLTSHYSHYEVTDYPLRACFLKKMRIPYKVYCLIYVTKLSRTCSKRIKGRRKQKKRKQKKRNKR